VRTIQMLDDVEAELVGAFKQALASKAAFVITTGAMGPGHQDITRECVAKALGLSLEPNKAAHEMLQQAYRRMLAKGVVDDAEINETRSRMALLPKGSTCFENPIGTAPGVSVQHGGTTFFMLPGTSEEMQGMFLAHVLPIVERATGGRAQKVRQIEYPSRDESALSKLLTEVGKRFPGVSARTRVTAGGESLTITLHADEADMARLELAEADLRARLDLDTGEQ
jgi:molybdopterin-biosynthesis enzyme MoeA-like protein